MSVLEIRGDLALHWVWGGVAGACGASACAVVAVVAGAPGLVMAMPGAAVLGALVAGVGKEAADWLTNRRARLAFRVPPHEVSLEDVVATVLGGAVVAVPVLLAVWGVR
jgi:hypothetical protein